MFSDMVFTQAVETKSICLDVTTGPEVDYDTLNILVDALGSDVIVTQDGLYLDLDTV